MPTVALAGGGVERVGRFEISAPDQLVGVGEVRRLNGDRAGRRQHDDARVTVERFDVCVQPLLNEPRGRVHGHPERSLRRLRECAGGARREHIDAVTTELERVADRRVVGDAAVDQLCVLPLHGGEHAGNGSTGQYRVERRPLGEAALAAAKEIDGDDVEGDRRLLEPVELELGVDQSPQRPIRDEVVAAPGEADEGGREVEGKDLRAAHPAPDLGEPMGRRGRLATGGDVGAVDRPDRGSDDHVGRNSALVERLQHPRLDRAQAGAAGEHEPDAHRPSSGAVMAVRMLFDLVGHASLSAANCHVLTS